MSVKFPHILLVQPTASSLNAGGPWTVDWQVDLLARQAPLPWMRADASRAPSGEAALVTASSGDAHQGRGQRDIFYKVASAKTIQGSKKPKKMPKKGFGDEIDGVTAYGTSNRKIEEFVDELKTRGVNLCSERDENNCHRRFVLEYLREHRSIRDMPLDELANLPTDRKLMLAEQLFDEARREYGVLMQRGVSFHMGDTSTAARRHLMRWPEERIRWFNDVEEAILKNLSASDELLFRNYMSSYKQLTQVGVSKLHAMMRREPVDAVRELQEEASREVVIDAGRGYRVGLERSELAFTVAIGLKENAVDFGRRGKRLVLKLPTDRLTHAERFELLGLVAWPPTPDNPILQSLQRILGWQFDIETAKDHVTFTIDFGESYLEKKQ